MFAIYCITNTENRKRYVGQTRQKPRGRWVAHLSAARNGSDSAIARAIRKYGEDKFEFCVIEEVETLDDANTRERFWIAKFGTMTPTGYNLTDGGDNSLANFSEESIQKMRERALGERNPFFGRKHSSETIEKLREMNTGPNHPLYGKPVPEAKRKLMSERMRGENHPMFGKPQTEESNEKRRAALAGENAPLFGVTGENHPAFGVKRTEEHRRIIGETNRLRGASDETKAKISRANSGRKHTEESKAKISAATKGENNPRYGKKLSEETKQKIREALSGENSPNFGKHFSEEHRAKISAKRKAWWESQREQKTTAETVA